MRTNRLSLVLGGQVRRGPMGPEGDGAAELPSFNCSPFTATAGLLWDWPPRGRRRHEWRGARPWLLIEASPRAPVALPGPAGVPPGPPRRDHDRGRLRIRVGRGDRVADAAALCRAGHLSRRCLTHRVAGDRPRGADDRPAPPFI